MVHDVLKVFRTLAKFRKEYLYKQLSGSERLSQLEFTIYLAMSKTQKQLNINLTWAKVER